MRFAQLRSFLLHGARRINYLRMPRRVWRYVDGNKCFPGIVDDKATGVWFVGAQVGMTAYQYGARR